MCVGGQVLSAHGVPLTAKTYRTGHSTHPIEMKDLSTHARVSATSFPKKLETTRSVRGVCESGRDCIGLWTIESVLQ